MIATFILTQPNQPKKMLKAREQHNGNVVRMFSDGGVDRRPAPEIEETNYIEPETEPVRDRQPQPRAQTPKPSPNENLERNRVSTEQMCKDCSHNTTPHQNIHYYIITIFKMRL